MNSLPNELQLNGKRLTLVNAEEADYAGVLELLNDPMNMRYLRFLSREEQGGWTLDAVKDRQKRRRERQKAGSGLFFDVVLSGSGEFIGTCGFPEIDLTHRRAEFGWIISHEHWRKHYATECLATCLAYAYETLGLNRVEFQTHVENTPMRGFFERFGIRLESVRKESHLENGRFVDFCVYTTLKKEWPPLKSRLEGAIP